MNVVELESVKKHYMLGETRVDALRGVSLSIGRGEFLAISGPSGSGKSTMLNMLGCIDLPSEGTVRINGVETARLNDRDLTRYRRTTVSFIFQSFNLIPVLNVYENIEFPLLLQKGLSRKERSDRVQRAIDEVGLADRIKNKSAELSGGQRQRVAIARALVTRPVIVLADEPTANLDSETGARIIELMKRINAEDGTTFIFSTHDSRIVSEARRVVRIRDGLVVDSDDASPASTRA